MIDEVAPSSTRCATSSTSATRAGTRCSPTARRSCADAVAERAAAAGLRRPDQHPVHVRARPASPRAPRLSHHNILNNGYFVGEGMSYTEHDRICVPVPFYHCFGMVMGNLAATSHGACVVIPAPGFDPAATLRAVAGRAVHVALRRADDVHRRARRCPTSPTYDLSTLRTGCMAGSPCPVEVMKRVISEMHMDEVTIAYGMTETSPVSTQTRKDDSLDRRTSTVGRVHPHVEVMVVDPETDLPVPRGRAGRAVHPGYSVMIGYWDEPEKTAEVLRNGWMHTGDLAMMDDEGYLNIVGRIKDMVIRGGENVYPREIEEFLYTHPDIVDAQVIGVPDEQYGEELMAWVRLREGAEPLTAEALREFCTGQARALQDPALRPRRRRVPDDGHRQGPQGRDARAGRRAPRPARRRRDQARLSAPLSPADKSAASAVGRCLYRATSCMPANY